MWQRLWLLWPTECQHQAQVLGKYLSEEGRKGGREAGREEEKEEEMEEGIKLSTTYCPGEDESTARCPLEGK